MKKEIFISDVYPDRDQVITDLRSALSSIEKGIRVLEPQPFFEVDLVAVDESNRALFLKVLQGKDSEKELVSLMRACLRFEASAASLCARYGLKNMPSASSPRLLIFAECISEEYIRLLSLLKLEVTCYECHYIKSGHDKALFLRQRSGKFQPHPISSDKKDSVKLVRPKIAQPGPPKISSDNTELPDEIQSISSSADVTVLSKQELSEFIRIEEEFKKVFSTP